MTEGFAVSREARQRTPSERAAPRSRTKAGQRRCHPTGRHRGVASEQAHVDHKQRLVERAAASAAADRCLAFHAAAQRAGQRKGGEAPGAHGLCRPVPRRHVAGLRSADPTPWRSAYRRDGQLAATQGHGLDKQKVSAASRRRRIRIRSLTAEETRPGNSTRPCEGEANFSGQMPPKSRDRRHFKVSMQSATASARLSG